MIIFHDPSCSEYEAPGHPERPERTRRTSAWLKDQTDLQLKWVQAEPAQDEALLRCHEPALIQAVRSATSFDADTPAYEGIDNYARRSVGSALAAARSACEGEPAFSLMRPPGHHATKTRAMGFCYFNSIACAAAELAEKGGRKVAVFDFDVHHGNGTEDILLGKEGLWFASVHQHPCYPGSGQEDRGSNVFNFPVPPSFPAPKYRDVLSRALERLMSQEPDVLAVSAGFDAYVRDPLSQETLEIEDYEWLGKQCANLSIPVFAVLEGGYSRDLPLLVEAFLRGWMA